MEYTNCSLQMILIFGLLLNYSKQILIMNKARVNVNLIYGMIKGIGQSSFFFLISQFRKGVIICIVAGPLFNSHTTNAFEWIDLWTTKDQQAKNAMSNEDYEKAKQLFKNENWKARPHKAGSFDQALDLFTNDSTSTGFYNQGNSFARMGELDMLSNHMTAH